MWYVELFEKTIRIDDGTGHMFVIMKNPSRAQFLKFISSPDCDVKGLLSENDFFCWPAWHAHHHQIAFRLGIEEPVLLYIRHDYISATNDKKEIVVNHPKIKAIYGDNVPFIGE